VLSGLRISMSSSSGVSGTGVRGCAARNTLPVVDSGLNTVVVNEVHGCNPPAHITWSDELLFNKEKSALSSTSLSSKCVTIFEMGGVGGVCGPLLPVLDDSLFVCEWGVFWACELVSLLLHPD